MDTLKIIGINRHKINTDGIGVRTLVGLAGCNLSCKYCINKDILRHPKIKEYTVLELIKKVMEDYCYFVGTDGGVTFGGGEPLLQIEQIIEFTRQTKSLFKTYIETSLSIQTDLEELLSLVYGMFIDIKSIDSSIYENYTGATNSILLQNLKVIKDCELQNKCVIRVPTIKEYTTEKSISESLKFLNDFGFKNIDTFEYFL